jgi:hypothetical protein
MNAKLFPEPVSAKIIASFFSKRIGILYIYTGVGLLNPAFFNFSMKPCDKLYFFYILENESISSGMFS